MKTKVKSFTLSEMLVVLIITAIVVGMAFSVLTLVRKQVNILKLNSEEETEIELLKSKFFIDFNTFSEVNYSEKKQIFFKNEIDSTFYIIKDNFIIENQDTLITKLNSVKIFYKKKIVTQGRIDAIEIEIEKNKKTKESIFIFKMNDAQEINEINFNGI